MKRFLFFMMAAMLAIVAHAQLYDGMTQPTEFRFWMPVSVSTETGAVNASPFAGYRIDPCKHLQITPVMQYNIEGKAFIPQIWLSTDICGWVYFMSRNIYNVKTNKFSETLSMTAKLPLGFMVDCTWSNLYDGVGFCNSDRCQVVAGYGNSSVAFNAGYSFRHSPGFIANVRFKITKYDWLQIKYDGGTKSLQAAFALQFNDPRLLYERHKSEG